MVPFQGRLLRSSTISGGKGRAPVRWRNMDRTFLPWNSHLHIMGSSPSGHQKGPPMMSDDESCLDSSKQIPQTFFWGGCGDVAKCLITESKYLLTNHHQRGIIFTLYTYIYFTIENPDFHKRQRERQGVWRKFSNFGFLGQLVDQSLHGRVSQCSGPRS